MRSYPRNSRSFPELRKPLFERSGRSPKRFCRENDVALSTLSFWLCQARQSARVRRAGVLVEVPVNVASTDSPRSPAALSPGSVHIRLPNRVELSVAAGTDSA
jgi:transposase-like protein